MVFLANFEILLVPATFVELELEVFFVEELEVEVFDVEDVVVVFFVVVVVVVVTVTLPEGKTTVFVTTFFVVVDAAETGAPIRKIARKSIIVADKNFFITLNLPLKELDQNVSIPLL